MTDTVTTASSKPSPSAETGAKPVSCGITLDAGELFKRVFVYTILSIITFGIYRFWAKTGLRQLLWSRTSVKGDTFHYTGTAGELFKGFAIAALLLFPISSAFSYWMPFTLGPNGEFTQTYVLLNIVYLIVIILLIAVATYSSLRYRLTRTRWRGVRFGASGKAIAYAIRYGFFGILSLLSFGLLYPVLRRSVTSYCVNTVRFGGASFISRLTLKSYYKIWILPALLFYFGAFVLVSASFEPAWITIAIELGNSDVSQQGLNANDIGKAVLGSLIGLALCQISTTWYAAREFLLISNSIDIGDPDDEASWVRLSCSTTVKELFLPQFTFVFGIIGGGAVVAILLSVLGGKGIFIMLAVSASVFLPALHWVVAKLPILRSALAGLNLENDNALDAILQRDASKDPNIGEGLADVMEVGTL